MKVKNSVFHDYYCLSDFRLAKHIKWTTLHHTSLQRPALLAPLESNLPFLIYFLIVLATGHYCLFIMIRPLVAHFALIIAAARTTQPCTIITTNNILCFRSNMENTTVQTISWIMQEIFILLRGLPKTKLKKYF